jgi:pSer/pThr/pTyr-binding forkhead associated (FHA) protein
MDNSANRNICEHCGFENPRGALICRQCYRLLTQAGRLPGLPGTTKNLTTSQLDSSIAEQAQAQRGEPARTPDKMLRIRIMRTGHEIVKPFQNGTLLIGRADPARNILPDIDLNPHDAFTHGISRTHALLRRERNRVLVQDLNSANHTYLNGERLPPNTPHQVRSGDLLQLGRMLLSVNFD